MHASGGAEPLSYRDFYLDLAVAQHTNLAVGPSLCRAVAESAAAAGGRHSQATTSRESAGSAISPVLANLFLHYALAKLHKLKAEVRRRQHLPIPSRDAGSASALRGHYQYYAVPGNIQALDAFASKRPVTGIRRFGAAAAHA